MRFYQVITTIDNLEAAKKLCKTVIEKKLAACSQISKEIMSIYWWQGKIDESNEYYCVFKTTEDKYSALEKCIKENHSYDTPEIIALEIINGSKKYFDWLIESLR